MKYRRTSEFLSNYENLNDKEKKDVKKYFPDLQKAFEGDSVLKAHFDLHPLKGWPGIYAGHLKHNFCFTFEFGETDDGEKVVFFRRIGSHTIYENP